jgi:hypothetical protein
MNPELPQTTPGSTNGIAAVPAPGTRSAEQIRADIVSRREALARDVDDLRGRVNEITDWRSQVRKHQTPIAVGAAVVGAIALGAFLFSRRR